MVWKSFLKELGGDRTWIRISSALLFLHFSHKNSSQIDPTVLFSLLIATCSYLQTLPDTAQIGSPHLSAETEVGAGISVF